MRPVLADLLLMFPGIVSGLAAMWAVCALASFLLGLWARSAEEKSGTIESLLTKGSEKK